MAGFVVNTEEQQKEMLEKIGMKDMSDLFAMIPDTVRFQGEFNLPQALSEMEVAKYIKAIAAENITVNDVNSFLGAGVYEHYIPSIISHIVGRQEFLTSYTPYQPEISQGTLQTIFEFQTMICELTGLPVANASIYDGATALTEAMNMACAETRRKEVILVDSVHPEFRKTMATYARFNGTKLITAPVDAQGQVDMSALASLITPQTAAICVQTPNFFGVLEDIATISEFAHANKSLCIVAADPIALSVLEAPGKLGADIVVGEGQCLGNALNFGGPYLGFMAVTDKLIRKMPGRLVGETVDHDGKRGFVLTMQTREQHIRREKATSNICSNQAINALTATIYLSWFGKKGLQAVANMCVEKAHYTYESLLATGKFTPVYQGPFFKEFAVKYNGSLEKLNAYLEAEGVLAGFALQTAYAGMENCLLVAVTETKSKSDIDTFIAKVGAYHD